MSGFMCHSVTENCKNIIDSYGEICVGCNCCGRIDKATMQDCRIECNAAHLIEQASHLNDVEREYADYQKRNCALSVISFAREIIKAIDAKQKQANRAGEGERDD